MGLERKTIAVDMMTAEKGVEPLARAVKSCLNKYDDISFFLIGEEDNSSIKSLEGDRVKFVKSTQIVKSTDTLRTILRKEDSSTYLTAKIVGENIAGVGLSFGNTIGVGIAISKNIRSMKYVDKSPFAICMPAIRNRLPSYSILLDVGSTAYDDCNSQILLQFGILASDYARKKGKINPQVGLLSNGKEITKGTRMLREANKLYSEHSQNGSSFRYLGFVESKDIFCETESQPDIVVTDGFSGNLVLKASEGLVGLTKFTLDGAFRSNPLTRLAGGVAYGSGVFAKIRKTLNPDSYGGACFLGLEHPFIKGHGSASEDAMRSALDSAYNAAGLYGPSAELEQELKRASEISINSRI
jgi:glycerol-3-phosphate acyltransferase PlsX